MEFEEQYSLVRHIVLKARRDYYIKSWELSDWDQEGMLVLYELLAVHSELRVDRSNLYRYYKVKFRNYVKDVIRKQESQKRKFDRMNYEEISDVGHMVSTGGLLTDELVCLRDRLHSYRSQLSSDAQAQYDALISGSRFKGRREMLRDLREYIEKE